jgi:mannose-6-phosphate isomerase-like protein (cupin superfamily)
VSAIRTAASADRAAALAAFVAEGCSTPRSWGNRPGDTYARHDHARPKVLFCLAGSITFVTDEGEIALAAGDRLDLPAGTRHAAVVGPSGCDCVEAWGPRR